MPSSNVHVIVQNVCRPCADVALVVFATRDYVPMQNQPFEVRCHTYHRDSQNFWRCTTGTIVAQHVVFPDLKLTFGFMQKFDLSPRMGAADAWVADLLAGDEI